MELGRLPLCEYLHIEHYLFVFLILAAGIQVAYRTEFVDYVKIIWTHFNLCTLSKHNRL